MIRWNNDYNHGAHPAVLSAFARTNEESYGGYGLDEWCQRASERIKSHLGNADADVHFMVGGTQVNYTVIAAALRPYQGVISADSGHIHVHETGAVENTGHKILAVKGENGKLSAESVEAEAENYRTSGVKEHITQPKMVYISFPTEYGTLYSKKELQDISAVCRKYGMYLMIDGARMGYGLGAEVNDVKLSDLAALADVFYIGGTKCGAMMGEAVVLTCHALKEDFRSYMKQNGGMLAKGWILGLQFSVLFEEGLYFEITAQADRYAMQIRKAFEEKGIEFYIDSPTNQQFVVLSDQQKEKLQRNHIFEYQFPVGEKHCVRFCTSWSTRQEDVDILEKDIRAL